MVTTSARMRHTDLTHGIKTSPPFLRDEGSLIDSSLAPSGGKKEQSPTAALAFLAFLAMWFV